MNSHKYTFPYKDKDYDYRFPYKHINRPESKESKEIKILEEKIKILEEKINKLESKEMNKSKSATEKYKTEINLDKERDDSDRDFINRMTEYTE